MNYCFIAMFVAMLLFVVACDQQSVQQKGPQADRNPTVFQQGSFSWSDPYAYLSDLESPQTQAYLNAEVSYFESRTKVWQSDISRIAAELNRDLPVERTNPAIRSGQYELSSKVPAGSQYPVYTRTHLDTGESEVILDTNQRANGTEYYRLGGFAMNGNLLALTEDRSADGLFDLYVINLESGASQLLASDAGASLGWNNDHVVFVSGKRFLKASTGGERAVLYAEPDNAFGLSIYASEDHLTLRSESHDTTEIRMLDAYGELSLISPRLEGHRYRVKFSAGRMVVLSNLSNQNFALAIAEPGDPADSWRFIDMPSEQRVFDFEPAATGVYLHVKAGMRQSIHYLSFADLSFVQFLLADAGEQLAFHTLDNDRLRFWRRSPLVPDAYWRISPDVSAEQIEQASLPESYDPGAYQLEQFVVAVRDGTEVPVTLCYREGQPLTDRPILMNAYGAYGLEQDLGFDASRLPLLRRGFILAWIHVRGGGELGADWHDAGRGLNKLNSFRDFQDVATALPRLGYGNEQKMAGRFASAGGAIGGFLINEDPELLKAVTLRSPFVDIVTTLLDETQPLTFSDRLEWGDPRDERYLGYQLNYSPYHQADNNETLTNVLVLAGRNDRLVRIYEPLKWFAKLRSVGQGEALMLIDIQQNSGHLGATDQYLRRQQTALELVFIFNRLGIRI